MAPMRSVRWCWMPWGETVRFSRQVRQKAKEGSKAIGHKEAQKDKEKAFLFVPPVPFCG